MYFVRFHVIENAAAAEYPCGQREYQGDGHESLSLTRHDCRPALCVRRAGARARGQPLSRQRTPHTGLAHGGLPRAATQRVRRSPGSTTSGSSTQRSFAIAAFDPATRYCSTRARTFVAAPWFGLSSCRDRPGASRTAMTSTIAVRCSVTNSERRRPAASTPRNGRLPVDTSAFSSTHLDDTIQFQAAVDGNGRYTVGWGLRGDPSFLRRSISSASGSAGSSATRLAWKPGPLGGSPTAINAFDVAVGTSDRSAIRYHVPTGQIRVLHAADSAHSIDATDINDLGEVAGRIITNAGPDDGQPVRSRRGRALGSRRSRARAAASAGSRLEPCVRRGLRRRDGGRFGRWPVLRVHRQQRGARRAVAGGRAFDLNTLIPRSAGITLTYAYSRESPRPDHRRRLRQR